MFVRGNEIALELLEDMAVATPKSAREDTSEESRSFNFGRQASGTSGDMGCPLEGSGKGSKGVVGKAGSDAANSGSR